MLTTITLVALLLGPPPGAEGTPVRRAPLPELQEGWTFVPDLEGMHSIGTYEDAQSGAVVVLEIGASESSRHGQCPTDPRVRVSRGTSGGMAYCQLDVEDARAYEIETIQREIPNFDPGQKRFAALARGLPAPGDHYVAVVFVGKEEAWFFYSYYVEAPQRNRILDLLIEGGGLIIPAAPAPAM